MSRENPYRAAGAFSGKAYIRRDADEQLLEQIDDNQYYPYFAAPRQSGKSSLLLRTMSALDSKRYRTAMVDLSPFVVTSYEDFWRQFLHEVARSANFDPTPIGQEDPRDVFLLWLRSCKQRLIVFMDEIDVLLGADFREQIFSKFRTFYNLRARLDTADLQRLQFVLAGAAHSSRFIKDPRWSPFNVAIEIELEDLSPAQVSQLAAYLGTAGGFAGPDLTARVFELSGGSVFLCQLIFEQLWNMAARGKQRLGAADVDSVVASIVAESPRNIHFYNIFRLVTADARLTMLFRRLTEGQELGQEEQKELRLTGICRGANPFRNEIYARVFGPAGPLDLKVGDKQIQLTRALDSAIDRRDRLQSDPRADPRTVAAAEAEIRRLRKEFREGSQLQVGDVLGRGRFRLEERIGQGGFATVWRAVDTRDHSEAALKVLHGQFAEDKSRRERFFRGAWKMSELLHPSIVKVIEPYGDENGHFYFAMEFLPGGTLHDAVQEERVTPERALKIIAAVGRALQFAHERGLIHRDVKPSNVIVDGDNGKLTDFDLVRDADITGGTRTGAMGTFLYAAPEVMSRPQDADVRADVYGLGMTTVFALYGGDLAMDVIRDADRFIDRLRCNAVLHDVLKKAVAWDRNDRFASAGEFVTALERASEVEEPAAQGKAAPVMRPAASAWAAAPAEKPRDPGAPGVEGDAGRGGAGVGARVSGAAAAASRDLALPPARMAPVVAASDKASVAAESIGARASGSAAVSGPAAAEAASGRGVAAPGGSPPSGVAPAALQVPGAVVAQAASPSAALARDGAAPQAAPARAMVAAPPARATLQMSLAPVATRSPPGASVASSPVAASSSAGSASVTASPVAVSTQVAASSPADSIPVMARPSATLPFIAGAATTPAVPGGDAIASSEAVASAAPELAVEESEAESDRFAADADAPWEREILVPERTGTRMLRAALERAEAAPRLSEAPLSGSMKVRKPAAHAETKSQQVAMNGAPAVEPAPEAASAPKLSRSGRMSVPLVALGLVAVLLLVFVLPRLLVPDDPELLTINDVEARKADARFSGGDERVVVPERQPPGAPELGTSIPTPPPTSEPLPDPTPASDPVTAPESGADPGGSDSAVAASTTGDGPEVEPLTKTTGVAGTTDRSSTAGDSGRHGDTSPTASTQVPVSELLAEGCLKVRSGDAEQGVALLLKAHDRLPGDMRVLGCIADGYAKLGRYDSAANFYERMLDRWDRHPKALLGAAQANEYLNRRVAAKVFYQRLLAVEPSNRSAQAFLAEDARQRAGTPEPVPLK